MELSGIKTYGISLKYSVPFRRGAEGIWWNFHSVPFHLMERNGPLVLYAAYVHCLSDVWQLLRYVHLILQCTYAASNALSITQHDIGNIMQSYFWSYKIGDILDSLMGRCTQRNLNENMHTYG